MKKKKNQRPKIQMVPINNEVISNWCDIQIQKNKSENHWKKRFLRWFNKKCFGKEKKKKSGPSNKPKMIAMQLIDWF